MANVTTVDVAILGAGTAGLGARRAAKAEGKSVVMIDPGPFGTTCARVGCMPSKLLIAAAEAAHHAEKAPIFGVHPGEVRVDGKAVFGRLRSERDRFVGFVNEVIDEAKEEGSCSSAAGRSRQRTPSTSMAKMEPGKFTSSAS